MTVNEKNTFSGASVIVSATFASLGFPPGEAEEVVTLDWFRLTGGKSVPIM